MRSRTRTGEGCDAACRVPERLTASAAGGTLVRTSCPVEQTLSLHSEMCHVLLFGQDTPDTMLPPLQPPGGHLAWTDVMTSLLITIIFPVKSDLRGSCWGAVHGSAGPLCTGQLVETKHTMNRNSQLMFPGENEKSSSQRDAETNRVSTNTLMHY